MRKYNSLSNHLVKQHEVAMSLTFQQVEQILGFPLPPSAYNHRAWWANSLSHPQASSWLNVGWKVDNVSIEKTTVCFVRPLILAIQKLADDDGVISLAITMNTEKLALIIAGPKATATTAYSWRQIIQMLIDMNPHMFGNFSHQPNHYIFPEMLTKLGYTVVNWETNIPCKM